MKHKHLRDVEINDKDASKLSQSRDISISLTIHKSTWRLVAFLSI